METINLQSVLFSNSPLQQGLMYRLTRRQEGFSSGKAKHSMYITLCGPEDMNCSKYYDALFSNNDLRQGNYQPNQTS